MQPLIAEALALLRQLAEPRPRVAIVIRAPTISHARKIRPDEYARLPLACLHSGGNRRTRDRKLDHEARSNHLTKAPKLHQSLPHACGLAVNYSLCMQELSLYSMDSILINNRKRIELSGIQIMRGIAATAVVCHHVLRKSDTAIGRFSPEWLTLSMSSGVDIFFVISGFIMLYVSFSNSGDSLLSAGEFVKRRMIRIVPLYWFWCIVLLILVASGIFAKSHYTSWDVFASFILLPVDNPLFAIAWTLTYELYFYVIFAVALVFFSRTMTALVSIAVILLILTFSNILLTGATYEFFRSAIVIEFCFGIGLASIYFRSERIWRTSWLTVALSVAIIAIAPTIVPHESTAFLREPFRVVVWGIPSIVLVAAAIGFVPKPGTFHRWLIAVGDASYSIYLTHIFILIAYSKVLKIDAVARIPQYWIVPIVIAFAIITGVITRTYVEVPLLRLTGILLRRPNSGRTVRSLI